MAIVLTKEQELCASLRIGDVIRLRGWKPGDARGLAQVIDEGDIYNVRAYRASMAGSSKTPDWSTYPTRVTAGEIAEVVSRAHGSQTMPGGAS